MNTSIIIKERLLVCIEYMKNLYRGRARRLLGPILLMPAPPSSFPASSCRPPHCVDPPLLMIIISSPPLRLVVVVSSSLFCCFPPPCRIPLLLVVVSFSPPPPPRCCPLHTVIGLRRWPCRCRVALVRYASIVSPSFVTSALHLSLPRPCIFRYVGLGILTPSCLSTRWCRDPYTFVSFDTLVLGSHSLRVPCRK